MLKALVVEDEEDIKQLLLEELEDKGFQVVLADDGEMALQRLSHYSRYHFRRLSKSCLTLTITPNFVKV